MEDLYGRKSICEYRPYRAKRAVLPFSGGDRFFGEYIIHGGTRRHVCAAGNRKR